MKHSIKFDDVKERLKTRREELKLSYRQLSDRTGLSKSTLQRYETEDIDSLSLIKLIKLSNALEIEPYKLLGWNVVNDDFKKNSNVIDDNSLVELCFNYNNLDENYRKKLLEYSNDLIMACNYSYSDKISKNDDTQLINENSTLEKHFTTIAAHDDDFTNKEKEEINKRILIALKEIKIL